MTESTTARRNMAVAQLFPNWVHDRKVLDAMYDVPREEFMPERFKDSAYADHNLPFADGRSILAPLTFARLLELANIWEDDRVLVLGALNGYAAAVAAELSNHVTAVDTNQAWLTEARTHFDRIGIGHIDTQLAKSLTDGYAQAAPYDAIVICGTVQIVPESIVAQLKEGGRLVAVRMISPRPGNHGGLGKGMLARRIVHELQSRDVFDAPASAVLPGFERAPGFVF